MEKHDIFISYSRKDSRQVELVTKILINQGYSVWVDTDGIESGTAFRGVIVEAIESSKIVLFFSSENSNNSTWTTKEISLAVDEGKYIIPIKLDTAKYNNNIRFDLIDLDYIDLTDRKLYETSINRLINTIKAKIAANSNPPRQQATPRPINLAIPIAGTIISTGNPIGMGLGIVGITRAIKASRLYRQGNIPGGNEYNQSARNFGKGAIFTGLAGIIILYLDLVKNVLD